MAFVGKFLVFVIVFVLSVYIIIYREKVVRMVGKNEWAERFLGTGGTYAMWIFLAIIFIILALLWLVGLPGRKTF